MGWGAVYEHKKTGGLWSLAEQQFHTNYLEMKAVLLGLRSLCSEVSNKHIRVQSDNTLTTVVYINAMGGIRSTDCNDMALQIWQWCHAKGGIFGSVPATYQAQQILRLTKSLDNLTPRLNGH